MSVGIPPRLCSLKSDIHFLEGGWAGGIPMSINAKSPSPPFIFLVKKCHRPPGSSKI